MSPLALLLTLALQGPPPLLQDLQVSELSVDNQAELSRLQTRGARAIVRLKNGGDQRGAILSFNAIGVQLDTAAGQIWIDASEIAIVEEVILREAAPAAERQSTAGIDSRTLGWIFAGTGFGLIVCGAAGVMAGLSGAGTPCVFCCGLGSLVGVFSTACGAIMVAVNPEVPPERKLARRPELVDVAMAF